MKVYAIMDRGHIYALYTSKEKAQEKSNQMKKELRFFAIGDAMSTHGFEEEEAKEWVENRIPIPDRLYEVIEMEAKE